LQQMDGAVLGVDDEFPIAPLGIFVSAARANCSEA